MAALAAIVEAEWISAGAPASVAADVPPPTADEPVLATGSVAMTPWDATVAPAAAPSEAT
jgi:hypothetical protein